ncbi:MAG TPA: hypothetical protein PKA21_08845 [Kiritimatiellia bacterium]|nr:hypothetical protein [Kiritimatiellia bacterium]HMP35040.1 hypothetical protein [Kiritimatiellia bacterium]
MRKPPDLWGALSHPLPQSAFMSDWQRLLGGDYAATRRFLFPCGLSMYWKCPDCPYPHQVRSDPGGDYLAVPRDDTCNFVRLKKTDVTLYRLDTDALLLFIASTLALSGKSEAVVGASFTWMIGVAINRSGLPTPVCLSLAHSPALFNNAIAALKQEYSGAFCMLTPTAINAPPRVLNTLIRTGHRYFTLSDLIKVIPGPAWVNLQPPSVLVGEQPAPEKIKEHPYIFEPHPAGWRIVFNHSKEMFLRNTLGARYLNHLLHHPFNLIHAIELESAVTPEKTDLRQRGVITDPSKKAAIGRLVMKKRKLEHERDHEQESGNNVAASECQSEIDSIESELQQLQKKALDDGEKARSPISKAIHTAYRSLEKNYRHSEPFVSHAREFLNISHNLQYVPPQGITWR